MDQAVEAEHPLMRCDLEDAVGRGVANRPASAEVFGPQTVNDFGPRGVAIAKDARDPGDAADFGHQVGRKGGLGVGEIVPLPRHGHTGEFPMARRRVLAARNLSRGPPSAHGRCLQPRCAVARRQTDRRAQAESVKVWQVQRTAAANIRAPCGTVCGDMAKGIGPRIAKIIGIGRAAAAHGIHHDQKGTGHVIFFNTKGNSSGADVPMR